TSADPLPNYDSVPYQSSLNLPLPAPAKLTGKVVDATGAGIASARVYARSAMGTPWSLSRSVNVDPDGSYSLALREGIYLVEAAMSADSGLLARFWQMVAASGHSESPLPDIVI